MDGTGGSDPGPEGESWRDTQWLPDAFHPSTGFLFRYPGIFGGEGERIELRHESTSYAPYVAGTLLAVRRVQSFKGLKRGMGTLLEL